MSEAFFVDVSIGAAYSTLRAHKPLCATFFLVQVPHSCKLSCFGPHNRNMFTPIHVLSSDCAGADPEFLARGFKCIKV